MKINVEALNFFVTAWLPFFRNRERERENRNIMVGLVCFVILLLFAPMIMKLIMPLLSMVMYVCVIMLLLLLFALVVTLLAVVKKNTVKINFFIGKYFCACPWTDGHGNANDNDNAL